MREMISYGVNCCFPVAIPKNSQSVTTFTSLNPSVHVPNPSCMNREKSEESSVDEMKVCQHVVIHD